MFLIILEPIPDPVPPPIDLNKIIPCNESQFSANCDNSFITTDDSFLPNP